MKKKTTQRKKMVKKRTTVRFEARVTPEEKEVLQQAADCLHISLSDLVRREFVPKAEEVVERHDTLRLNKRDSKKFVESLVKLPETYAKKFRKGAEFYKDAKARGILVSEHTK